MSDSFPSIEQLLTIGEMSQRTGTPASALRFYESLGLITSRRTDGNQRRYHRSLIRRISIVRAAQGLGLPLERIREALDALGAEGTPTEEDWLRMSQEWREELEQRIQILCRLRDALDACIGCGCLSLERCALFNKGDKARVRGPGPRYLLGDRAADIEDPT